jgi:hypothetical protein
MVPFLHQFFDVLKVAFHLHFEMLLHVANVDLVGHLTSNSEDDNQHSAQPSILTLAWFSAASVVGVSYFKIQQSNNLTPSDNFVEISPMSISLMFGKRW